MKTLPGENIDSLAQILVTTKGVQMEGKWTPAHFLLTYLIVHGQYSR